MSVSVETDSGLVTSSSCVYNMVLHLNLDRDKQIFRGKRGHLNEEEMRRDHQGVSVNVA
jgi:hypothetical protein